MKTGVQLYIVRACIQNEKDFEFRIKKLQKWTIKQYNFSQLERL